MKKEIVRDAINQLLDRVDLSNDPAILKGIIKLQDQIIDKLRNELKSIAHKVDYTSNDLLRYNALSSHKHTLDTAVKSAREVYNQTEVKRKS